MRTKNLLYLLLALSSILVACNKRGDDEGKAPATNYDVELEAKYLLAEYWGDENSPGADNYLIIISENKFEVNLGGESLSEGSYYFIDIYAPVTKDGNIPAGTYKFDVSESHTEWTIDGYACGYVEVDANGNFIPDEEGLMFSDATLVIKENYAELTAVIDGKTHLVTYSGKFAKIDSTNMEDIIRETTLLDDVEIECEDAMFISLIDEGMAYIIAAENPDMGALFMVEVALADGSDSISGTYSVADGTLGIGRFDEINMFAGSWYFDMVDGDLGSEYAAIDGGSVTFVQEGESCQMTLDCCDAQGYTIKATLSGVCFSDDNAEAAMQRLNL